MMDTDNESLLDRHLNYLKLPFMRDQHHPLAEQAAKNGWSHEDYLEKLADGEAALRKDRSIQRRIRMARFPVVKTLDQFNWTWPKKINRLQVQHLFRLQFIKQASNVIFIGGVGVGKTHLASALGYAACLEGLPVLFATAIDVINTLSAAQAAGTMKQALKKFTRPSTNSAFCPSIKPGPTFCSRSSVYDTNKVLWSSPPTGRLRTGRKFSTTTVR